MLEFFLFLISILGTISAIWLGGGRSHFHPNEPMPKPRFVAALVVVIVAQSGQYWMSHRRADADAAAQVKLNGQVGDLLESNKRLEERNGTLQLAVAEAKALLEKFRAETQSHALKAEAQAFKQEQETLATQDKMEQVRQAVDDRKGFGNGPYGNTPFGDNEPPLGRIARSLWAIGQWMTNDLAIWMTKRDAWPPRRQVVEYLSAVEKIPKDYNDAEWRATESIIYADIAGEIVSNLASRGMATQGRAGVEGSALAAERQRCLAAHARQQK
jgi:hypothetical protein